MLHPCIKERIDYFTDLSINVRKMNDLCFIAEEAMNVCLCKKKNLIVYSSEIDINLYINNISQVLPIKRFLTAKGFVKKDFIRSSTSFTWNFYDTEKRHIQINAYPAGGVDDTCKLIVERVQIVEQPVYKISCTEEIES